MKLTFFTFVALFASNKAIFVKLFGRTFFAIFHTFFYFRWANLQKFIYYPNISNPEIFNIRKLFAYLNEKQGIKTHTTIWEMSEELQTVMKQFLEGFVDFAYKLYGEKPNFEVRRIAVGLELEITTSPTLSLEQIDEALSGYVSGSFTEVSNFEQRELIRQLQEERFVLKMRLERILDQKQFVEKENSRLYLDIQYFKEQNHQLLQIVQNQQHQVEIKAITSPLKEEIQYLISDNRWEKAYNRLYLDIQYFKEQNHQLLQIVQNQYHQVEIKAITSPLKQEIQDLIANNRLEKAFEKLDLYFKAQKDEDLLDKLIDCKSRWNASNDKYHANIINEENHNIALGKIRNTLLDLAKKIEK